LVPETTCGCDCASDDLECLNDRGEGCVALLDVEVDTHRFLPRLDRVLPREDLSSSPVLEPLVDTGGVDVSRGWEFRAIVGDRDPVAIAGVDPWQVKWEPVPVGSVVVAHPTYPAQRHSMSVYKLSGVDPAAFFAAGEFSNAVWGFYEPTESMRDFLLTRID
jgi:hypothetical protein